MENLTSIKCTQHVAPIQFEAKTASGNDVYIRHRGNRLNMKIADNTILEEILEETMPLNSFCEKIQKILEGVGFSFEISLKDVWNSQCR